MADMQKSASTGSEVGEFQRPTWSKDTDSPNCDNCEKPFSTFRRRHHCRACGGVFCDECSQKRIELPPAFKYTGKERVCDECYHEQMKSLIEAKPELNATKPDYNVVHADLMDRLRKLLSEPDMPWLKRVEARKVEIYTLKVKHSPLWLIKSVVRIPVDLTKVVAMYAEKGNWKQWQPDMLECRTIEMLNPDPNRYTECLYITYRVPVIDNRDCSVYSCGFKGSVLQEGDENCFTYISTSITHPAAPAVKGFVRAHIGLSCASFLREDKDGQPITSITTIIHADPKGLVPLVAVNQAFAKAADSIAEMVDFMMKHKDD
eukprot:m.223807 g.223807  ORF g.223807 m.223807 type:complete len:318 (+) comp54189_c0_seq3:427-1380(+)